LQPTVGIAAVLNRSRLKNNCKPNDMKSNIERPARHNSNTLVSCRLSVGDKVKTKYDVFSETEYDKLGAKNVGKETYIVNKVEWWQQGEGYLVFGEKSDKRNCQVWHQECDLELVAKNRS
jgi:hypothetical protein